MAKSSKTRPASPCDLISCINAVDLGHAKRELGRDLMPPRRNEHIVGIMSDNLIRFQFLCGKKRDKLNEEGRQFAADILQFRESHSVPPQSYSELQEYLEFSVPFLEEMTTRAKSLIATETRLDAIDRLFQSHLRLAFPDVPNTYDLVLRQDYQVVAVEKRQNEVQIEIEFVEIRFDEASFPNMRDFPEVSELDLIRNFFNGGTDDGIQVIDLSGDLSHAELARRLFGDGPAQISMAGMRDYHY